MCDRHRVPPAPRFLAGRLRRGGGALSTPACLLSVAPPLSTPHEGGQTEGPRAAGTTVVPFTRRGSSRDPGV